jgi:hypothetical protein
VEAAQSCGARDYLGGLFHYRKRVNRVTVLDETMPEILYIKKQKENNLKQPA